jgi:uncharacterized membrane protein YsdA (DUF1294 family)
MSIIFSARKKPFNSVLKDYRLQRREELRTMPCTQFPGDYMTNILAYALIGMTLVGVAAMWLDKRSARLGAWRTPEKTLFLIACAGGGIGVWAGMYLFRHKTKHWQFVYGIPAIIAVQAYCLYRLAW